MSRGEVIVDIKLSSSGVQDAELLRYGYVQVIPDFGLPNQGRPPDFASIGTFGRGQSMWVWRRKQGTCSGRFRPVIDIQLDAGSTSSAMVLSGYVCVPVPVSGQWLWVKRASTDEEEKDAIVDIHVTLGKAKNPSDRIWQGPGVGWLKVEGNFSKGFFSSQDSFVWFRPSRTRSNDTHLSALIRSSLGLSLDVRQGKILSAVRSAIRHHVPLNEVKRLANLKLEDSSAGSEDPSSPGMDASRQRLRSDRIFDFSALFHLYDPSGKGQLSKGKFSQMLTDVGVKMESDDVNRCFYFFNTKIDSKISREEYAMMLSLTDYEIDVLVDKIRDKLLRFYDANPTESDQKSKDKDANGKPTSNKLRDNVTLSNVFSHFNTNADGILSLDEILDCAHHLEIFLTEEEGRKIMKMMDLDGDDRVEESDFIAYMKQPSKATIRKAHRVREAASILRRWLLRGTGGVNSQNDTATAQIWKQFQLRHEKASQAKFPGYLCAEDIAMVCATLGVRVSMVEARELCLLMGPEKNGRIHQSDLTTFKSRSCRSFGELIAILERDLLKTLIDAYRANREALIHDGIENAELAEKFESISKEVVRQVQGAYIVSAAQSDISSTSQSQDRSRSSLHDVVSLYQLKSGIEVAMRGFTTPENQLPNLEEWACLSCLVSAAVAEDDTYGVRVKAFLDGICSYIVNSKGHDGTEKMTLDMVARDLQRMIVEEAKIAGASTKSKKLDYAAVFAIFDEDQSGVIDTNDFKKLLVRLQIVDELPESDLPNLMALLDRRHQGKITLDDFIAFAEANREYMLEEVGEDGDDGAYENKLLDSKSKPPTTVTKNKDCDDLLWAIWKECYKRDHSDPEGVITEVESLCAEIETSQQTGAVTVKELWNLLHEVKIRTSISKTAFEKGIAYVVQSGSYSSSIKDDEVVDYESLFKYVVRMGRAHNALVQEKRASDEKRFEQLLFSLRRELAQMIGTPPASDKDTKTDVPRFEKVFSRLDSDGDGLITVSEFKIGLQRLQVQDLKQWNTKMIRRLFDEFDDNRDGFLSLKEFYNMIYDGDRVTTTKGGKNRLGGGFLSDDEDDDIFSKKKGQGDAELFRKVGDVLYENIPVSNSENDHIDEVKSAIRKFFSKSDPDGKGTVSEERFRAFCRRSGLQDRLSAGELRRLMDKLRKRRPGAKEGAIGVIEYDKLVRQIIFSADGAVPRGKAEGVLQRLQEAAAISAASGRAFLGLCSLVDPHNTGRITKDELIHTAKIMGCNITSGEVDALKALMPESSSGREDTIDYKDLYYLMTHHTPRDAGVGVDPRGGGSYSTRMTPSYHLGTMTPIVGQDYMGRAAAAAVATPGGVYLSTPYRPSSIEVADPYYSRGGRGAGLLAGERRPFDELALAGGLREPGTLLRQREREHLSTSTIERTMAMISSNVRLAIVDKSRALGSPFSLLRQFEVFDPEGTGLVSLRTFQGTLDDIGVMLTASELQVVHNLYGRPEDEKINYEAFCHAMNSSVAGGGDAGGFASSSSIQALRRSGARDHLGSSADAPYINARTIQRVRELRSEGRDPRDMFEAHDLDRTGMIDIKRFREVAQRLQLLQSEHQLSRAIEDYSSLSNKSQVVYEDFCRTLEEEEKRTFDDRRGGGRGGDRDRSGNNFVYGSGHDGFSRSRHSDDVDDPNLATDNVEKWLNQEASPKQRREFTNVYDSLQRFKSANERSSGDGPLRRSYNRDRDFYDDENLPPKLSDSVSSFGRSGSVRPPLGRERYGDVRGSRDNWDRDRDRDRDRDGYLSPTRLRGSGSGFSRTFPESPSSRHSSPIHAPRATPSQVGTTLYGKDVPLSKRGKVPKMEDGFWCCAVCLYVENVSSAKTCAVCDTPNYNKRKDFQVKEQCMNCTFLNGQFAIECEMCGEQLVKDTKY